MLMTVKELREYLKTDETEAILTGRLKALELTIRRYTNNNLQMVTGRMKISYWLQRLNTLKM